MKITPHHDVAAGAGWFDSPVVTFIAENALFLAGLWFYTRFAPKVSQTGWHTHKGRLTGMAALFVLLRPAISGPGPVAPGDEARDCFLPLTGPIIEIRGTFLSYAALNAWLDRVQQTVAEVRKKGTVHVFKLGPPTFEPFRSLTGGAPLIMCDQDLNMLNIIVGDNGRLWLVDWK